MQGKGIAINEESTEQLPSSTQQSGITQQPSQVISPNRVKTRSSQSEAGPSTTKKQLAVTTLKKQANNIMFNGSEGISEPDTTANNEEKPPEDAANEDGEA
ncbi:phosphoglycerate kinase [Sesbania bispinosa]|nr:phosphoglycerate kinase [Sesbania bispinosa]